jgi:hypothetical protein
MTMRYKLDRRTEIKKKLNDNNNNSQHLGQLYKNSQSRGERGLKGFKRV